MSAPVRPGQGQPAWVGAQQRPPASRTGQPAVAARPAAVASRSAVVSPTTASVQTVQLVGGHVITTVTPTPPPVAVVVVSPHAVVAPVIVGNVNTNQPNVLIVHQVASRQPPLIAGRQIPGSR